jgi:nitrogen fixation protein FixH
VQRRIGWRASVSAARLDSGLVRISVGLTQADGQPETNTTLHGELRHPADENKDRELTLKETRPGLYQADLSGIASGSWDVLVGNADKAAPFEAVRRLWVP